MSHHCQCWLLLCFGLPPFFLLLCYHNNVNTAVPMISIVDACQINYSEIINNNRREEKRREITTTRRNILYKEDTKDNEGKTSISIISANSCNDDSR